MITRRDFLKLGSSAAILSSFPDSIRKALAIPAYNATGTIQDVQHVVILMQENRSFDHYLGTLRGVRGFSDRITIPLPKNRTVWQQDDGQGNYLLPFRLDQTLGNAQRFSPKGEHSWLDASAAWDKGRMSAWVKSKKASSMAYLGRQELEFQHALAEAFTICDAYFCSLHGGTNTNRLFHMTGTNGPTGDGPYASKKSIVDNFWDTITPQDTGNVGYDWMTYPERLQQAGVSWMVYQNMPDNFYDNSLVGFKAYRKANIDSGLPVSNSATYVSPPYDPSLDAWLPLYKGVANTMPDGGFLEKFKEDIINNRLPQVSWINAPESYCEHPDTSSPIQGAWYTQQVLEALTSNPEVWSKTVLILNFDENDRYFDHVPPPCAPSYVNGQMAGKTTLSETSLSSEYYTHPSYYVPPNSASPIPAWTTPDGNCYGPGPRVPMYVISPWSRGGWVNSQAFDHTSILRFLETRFGVRETQISDYRRAVFGDLTTTMNFATPNDAIPTLNVSLTKSNVDQLRKNQEGMRPITAPSQQLMPIQAQGSCLSRALPYELQTSARIDQSAHTVKLIFTNSGTAAAVFHVYDKCHLEDVPRRYMVQPDKQLEDTWTTSNSEGLYDLWVLGPNGYHRAFAGKISLSESSNAPRPEIQVDYDADKGDVYLHLINESSSFCTLTASSDPAYGSKTQQATVGGQYRLAKLHWDLQENGCWYDITVTSSHDPLWRRRLAGRVETGKDSITDPAM
jgi:phospholipase C